MTLTELSGFFVIYMTPESMEEAAIIIRLKMNGTKKIRDIYCSCYKDGNISGSVVIGKRKQPVNSVKS